MRVPTLVAILLLASLPVAAGSTTYTYVAGSHVPPPKEMGALCITGEPNEGYEWIPPHGIGGACGIAPSDRSSVTVTVQDLLGNPVGFLWVGTKEAESGVDNVACGHGGTGFGTLTFELEDPCLYVNVYPDLGSVAGTITVS